VEAGGGSTEELLDSRSLQTEPLSLDERISRKRKKKMEFNNGKRIYNGLKHSEPVLVLT